MVKAVLFDFGQTLVDSAQGFRRAEKEAETMIFDDLGVDVCWSEFLADYRELRQEFHAQSNFSRKDFWQQVYRHYHKQPDRDVLSRAERDYWKTVSLHTQPFPEVRSTLEQLLPAYRLGMVTNSEGQEDTDRHRLNLFPDLARFFEIVVVAGEAGVLPKPHPEPFLLCLRK